MSTTANALFQVVMIDKINGSIHFHDNQARSHADAQQVVAALEVPQHLRAQLDMVSACQVTSMGFVEHVARRMGAALGQWKESECLGKWSYIVLTYKGQPLSIGVSDGGVVSVNGDPFTMGHRIIANSYFAVQKSITDRLGIYLAMKPVQSEDFAGILRTLVSDMGNTPVLAGQTLFTDRGAYVIEGGHAPQHEASTGKVFTDRGTFYPSVINAHWAA